MILTETVKVKSGTRGTKRFKEMGYVTDEDGYYNVKPQDMPHTSQFRILVQCDVPGCNNQKNITIDCYNKIVEKRGCYKCRICGNDDAHQTMINRYGHPFALQVPEIMNAYKERNQKKYNADYYTETDEFKRKAVETLMTKYGVSNGLLVPEIKEKIRSTVRKRYGCDTVLQNDEIRMKTIQSMYKNGTVPTSKQQRYLNELYGGELNYPIKFYNGDVVLLSDKIDIEYSGGGHNLAVIKGTMTAEEYKKYEIKRSAVIKSEGYKQIEIVSTKDLLPTDEILLKMLADAKQYFADYPNHSWVQYNIDKKIMRNAEHLDGISYFYGDLQKLRS